MKKRLLTSLTFIFLISRLSVSFAAENTVDAREAAIDRAIGGMEEGSRLLLPQGDAQKDRTRPVGENLNPSMDTRATASAPAQNVAGSSAIGSVANLGGGTQETAGDGATGTTLEGNTTVESPAGSSTEPTTESTNSGSADNSIITVGAGVDLSGESPVVDANLAVDTNAGDLLDANAVAETDAASADITVVESGVVAGQDLTTTVNEAPIDAILDAEIAATDIPAESEATAGLEADVDPVVAENDTTLIDPADGLSAGL